MPDRVSACGRCIIHFVSIFFLLLFSYLSSTSYLTGIAHESTKKCPRRGAEKIWLVMSERSGDEGSTKCHTIGYKLCTGPLLDNVLDDTH